MDKKEIQKQIDEIETAMNAPGFWDDKAQAQQQVAKHTELKDALEGVGKYDKLSAVVTVLPGAGGSDAEDFAGMLTNMYTKYAESQGYSVAFLHEHRTDHGGFRNVSFEIQGKGVYGKLQHESGVHRLVRISPFNAAKKRHTSFVKVEVIPKIPLRDFSSFEIPKDDLEVEFAKSGGPGGQNINKRETAVRITHTPTGLSVHASGQRTQEANREDAMSMLHGRLVRFLEDQQKEKIDDLSNVRDVANEWGSQMRSYVLHPYKMVKDHITGIEVRDIDKVLERGDLEPFILAHVG